MAAIAVGLTGLLFGGRGALSAGLGGVVCCLPNLACAGYLTWAAKRKGGVQAHAFFVGEAIKFALILGLLAVIRLSVPDVHWGALLLGLIVTLQANFLVFLVKP